MGDKGTNVPNKNDFISREAEIQFFNKWKDDLEKQIDDSVGYPHLRSDYKVCKTQLLDCIHAIKEMPAADVRPVVRARWYWDNYKYDWCCSNCFHSADHHIEKDDVYKIPSFPFCPHCGANMREPNLDTTKGDNHD